MCERYAEFGVKYCSWKVGHHAGIIVIVFIYLFIYLPDTRKKVKIYTYKKEILKGTGSGKVA